MLAQWDPGFCSRISSHARGTPLHGLPDGVNHSLNALATIIPSSCVLRITTAREHTPRGIVLTSNWGDSKQLEVLKVLALLDILPNRLNLLRYLAFSFCDHLRAAESSAWNCRNLPLLESLQEDAKPPKE